MHSVQGQVSCLILVKNSLFTYLNTLNISFIVEKNNCQRINRSDSFLETAMVEVFL